MPLSYDLKAEIIRAETTAGYLLFGDRAELLQTEDETLWSQLAGDVSQYDMLERDAHIRSVLQKRKHAVIAQEWDIKPASDKARDKKAAEGVKKLLERLDFDQVCLNLLDAILKGYSIGEVIWTQDKYGIYPDDIRSRSPARFVFVRPEKPNPKVCSIGGYELRADMRLISNQQSKISNDFGQLPDRKFIVHSFGSKKSSPMGCGLGTNLWWLNKFKKEAIKCWVIYNDRYAHPTPYGKFPPGSNRTELDRFLSTLSRGSWASLPQNFEIAFLESNRSGAIDTYEKFLSFCDSAISKVVLGETLTTEMDGGSYAAANVHNDVRMELAKSDADLLSNTLNKTLIRWLVDFNFPGAEAPTLWRSFPQIEDLNARANRDKTLFDMGFKLKFEALTEIYGDDYEEAQQNEPNAAPGEAPVDPDAELQSEIADTTSSGNSDGNQQDTQTGDQANETIAQMSEAPEEDNLDRLAANLKARSSKAVEQWTSTISDHVNNAQSFEELRDGLFDLYPTLDRASFADNLAQSMAVADLYGRYEVLQESPVDYSEFEAEYSQIEQAMSAINSLESLSFDQLHEIVNLCL